MKNIAITVNNTDIKTIKYSIVSPVRLVILKDYAFNKPMVSKKLYINITWIQPNAKWVN